MPEHAVLPVHHDPARPSRRRRTRRRVLAAVAGSVVVLTAAACGSGSSGSPSSGSGGDPKTLVVATHDSWAMSKSVMKEFTAETGITVKIQPQADAGQLTSKLVLTKDDPIADGVYGVDNLFAPRAVKAGVFAPYTTSKLPADAATYRLEGSGADRLTPVDYSDVCVNVDDAWFAAKGLTPPRSLDDLTDPRYKGLFVTPGATTSSPGLAFLVATIAAKGESGWKSYWSKLMANGTKIDAGWTEAYESDFTAGGGKGSRPVVTSYSSSPPFTIPKGASKPTTSALLDTCYRQVEYAGVLTGSKNPAGMRKFIDFMLGRDFQKALPDNMYVYPVVKSVGLPADWAKFATVSPKPYRLPAEQVRSKLDGWLRDWRDVTSR
ncbi:MAG: transporter, periplasmic binding protein thiB subfamily [Marmoricola sp.]|nr:transporter, periplasmic binding protein thiB subfamily [Marmoricola sp.]